MRRFWGFRSNLRIMEYYHKFKDLETFKKKCHDYYMLFPLWLLTKDYFDEVIIWRLSNHPVKDIIFEFNGKRYIQKWVKNFNETFKYPSPSISFFRGGFSEYDVVTKARPKHFGKKIYLGAGRRIFSQWQGEYDAYLIEDERDFVKNANCIPFFKTASSEIFHPIKGSELKWDICWPCNFTQSKYKGQKYFISLIAKNPILQKMKIVHCGNKPEVGKKICARFGVKNIEFLGSVDRPKLNEILNNSGYGLNLSNLIDGCPRVSSEVLMSGTPLILRDSVRLLKYFRKKGVVNVNDDTIVSQIIWSLKNYKYLKEDVLNAIDNELSFDNVNQQNINLWQKI